MEEKSRMMRLHAAVVHRSLGGKDNEKKYWPLWSDKQTPKDIITVDKDMYKKIVAAHGLKLKKDK